MQYKLVIFDMDGVIFQHKNIWLEFHRAVGTFDEGIKATKQYLHSDYEKLVEIVIKRLWKGADAQPFLELIAKVNYQPGVQETVKALHARGYTLAIITSGPARLLERAQAELGIDLGFANHLDIEDGRVTGRSHFPDGSSMWPIQASNKIPYAEQLCKELAISLKECIMVGDGLNDLPIFKAVGMSIAFNTKNEQLIEAATHHIQSNDLREILKVIP